MLQDSMAETSSETASVTVARRSRNDIGLRETFVFLDGKDIAILQNGDAVTVRVTPGAHRIRAHNTLIWKTIDFEMAAGQEARFVASNRPGWGTFSVFALIGAGPVYLTFERETASD